MNAKKFQVGAVYLPLTFSICKSLVARYLKITELFAGNSLMSANTTLVCNMHWLSPSFYSCNPFLLNLPVMCMISIRICCFRGDSCRMVILEKYMSRTLPPNCVVFRFWSIFCARCLRNFEFTLLSEVTGLWSSLFIKLVVIAWPTEECWESHIFTNKGV